MKVLLESIASQRGCPASVEVADQVVINGRIRIRDLIDAIVGHQVALDAKSIGPRSAPTPIAESDLEVAIKQGTIRPMAPKTRKIELGAALLGAQQAVQDGWALISVNGLELDGRDLDRFVRIGPETVIRITRLTGLSGQQP